MYRKLTSILVVLALAFIIDMAVSKWLDRQIPGWMPPAVEMDGSALSSSRAYLVHVGGSEKIDDSDPFQGLVLPYYHYLDHGGQDWLTWRGQYDAAYADIITSAANEADQHWRAQVLRVFDRTSIAKYASLLLLLLTIILFFGNFLREQYWWTPLYYILLVAATAAIYSAFSAPIYVALVGGGFAVYAISLRLMLPIYTYEWSKSLRPFLTFLFFLLAMMAFRGPKWLDYLYWTSDLYRFLHLATLLLSLYYHWRILDKALTNAELSFAGRVFGYCTPLGITAIVVGLGFGFQAADTTGALTALNNELLLFPPATVASFDATRIFVLFFAGVVLLIGGGIGYSIQRIAK